MSNYATTTLTFFKTQTSSFFSFLASPKNNLLESKKGKILLFVFLICLNMVVSNLISATDFLFGLLEKANFFSAKNLILDTGLDKDLLSLNKYYLFFLLCFIGPLIEEIVFRLPLNKKFSAIFLIPLIIFGVNFSFSITSILTSITILLFIGITLLLSYIQFKKSVEINETPFLFYYFNLMYSKWFTYLFYTSALVFSFSHIENYQWTSHNFANGFIKFSLSFITDLSFGYLMLRCGFIYTFVFHCFYNFVVFLGS